MYKNRLNFVAPSRLKIAKVLHKHI